MQVCFVFQAICSETLLIVPGGSSLSSMFCHWSCSLDMGAFGEGLWAQSPQINALPLLEPKTIRT